MATVMESRRPCGSSLTTADLEAMLDTPPTKEFVIATISDEAHVNRRQAKRFVAWSKRSVWWSRRLRQHYMYLSGWEVRRYHDILLAIAPDDKLSKPGSAHDLWERYVLGATSDHERLIHGSRDGKRRACSIRMIRFRRI